MLYTLTTLLMTTMVIFRNKRTLETCYAMAWKVLELHIQKVEATYMSIRVSCRAVYCRMEPHRHEEALCLFLHRYQVERPLSRGGKS